MLGGNLGVGAIEEFTVLTSNYSAEYGKTAGGVVDAITRSGTNQIHGSAYEFIRNSAVEAESTWIGHTVPPFKRNQFGSALPQADPFQGKTLILATRVYSPVPGMTRYQSAVDERKEGDHRRRWHSASPCPANTSLRVPAAHICVDNNATKFLALEPVPNRPVVGNGIRRSTSLRRYRS